MRLGDVLDGDLCAGCGLCVSILGPGAARMQPDARGYERPVLERPPSPEEDALIDAVCPGGRLDQAWPQVHAVWGPVRSLHTAWATDEVMRFRASSGGALSALLDHLLETGEVDYVLHIGADEERRWLNRAETSTTHEEVVARAGSRYVPSAPLADLVQRLERPERFAVVGKPCDIAGLRMYARHDARVAEKVPLMLAFMCGGVPSERGVLELLERMDVEPSEVADFRYRGHGWPGRATATLHDGQERSLSYDETWGQVLSKHVQRRCKICPDGLGAFADVVCADAWHLDETGRPSFEEREGRSLVLARTERGARVVEAAAAAGRVVLGALDLAELERMQPHQARRTRLTPSRLLAMRALGRAVPRYRGLLLARAALQAGMLPNLKSFLGALRRVLRGRL